jgi:hypothetical protein
MQKWQNQSMGQPMTSQDALAWAKGQSTLNQDATYLPMGGPNGAPAFAFHVKGGGMNIVPVSQMVQRGAGPLVASQNTSQVISQADQQQQAGAQGQPPAPQGDQGQPPPQIAQGPPAAPVGPLPGQPQVAQAQPQYPNISGPPPAPIPGAYNPAPYRQAIAQAIANPRNLMAQTAQAGTAANVPVTIQPQRDMWDSVPSAQQTTINAQAKAMGDVDVQYELTVLY